MASIYTNYYNGRRLRIDYTYTQNYAANTSYVTAKAYKELLSGYIDGSPDEVYRATITIDGSSVNVSVGVPITSQSVTYIGQYSKTIYHNSDGNKQIYIQGYFSSFGLYTNNTLVTLATIPRYSYFTQLYVVSTNLTQATIHWEADSVVGYADYNINGGAPIWASGPEFTVSNLAPGTTYTIKLNIRRLDSGLWYSQNINVTTKDIARVTGGNNITDEQNPYMTFTNPSGAPLKAFIEVLNPTQNVCVINDVPNTGNYTFVLTQAEKDIIYTKCANSNSTTIRYGIATKVNGSEAYWHWIDRTISIVNANPIFSNFTYQDANVDTKALTGNNQKIIKGYSTLVATVSNSNKAVSQKVATMSKYTLITGSKAGVDGTYSDANDVSMAINNADGNVASVYAIDSRNNSTKKDIPVNLIDYWPINIQAVSAIRGTGGIGTDVTLNFNGDIWNNSFGDVLNSIVSATYKYKKTTDIDYINGTTIITPTVTDNTYSKSTIITGDLGASGFNSAYSYNIQVTITDKLSSITQNIVLQSGKPQLAFGIGKGVAFGNFYDTNEGGDLQVLGKNILNLIFPIGRGFIDTTDTDYSNYLGFTWVKFALGKTLVGKDGTTEFAAIGQIGGAKTHILTLEQIPPHGHAYGGWIGWYASGGQQGIIGIGTVAGNTTNAGGGQAHNNLQPYEVVNYWKRTA